MLYKLSIRNAKRSMKDYLIYMITMAGVAAFMYAFNSLIFSDIVQKMWETIMVMTAMIGIVTLFIILIVAWLINYMVHFMLEKRSREFGTYLLLGMNKKQISKLYMRENMLLGTASFVAGILAGTVLQQILMNIFYHLFSQDYQIHIGGSFWCFLMTVGCYALCYFFALRKNRKIFKKMSIMDFMEMDKQTEKMETGREKYKQWLFFVSIAYFILFYAGLFRGNYTMQSVIVSVIFFIAAIYLFYHGLAAYLVCYIHKGGKKIFSRDGLFLFRQLSSKMRTMRFTMGTLTFLFTGALLGGMVAMMFTSYQGEAIDNAVSFDIMVYSQEVREDFAEERKVLKEENVVEKDSRIYRIYTDEKHVMNDYLYTHVSSLAGMFTKEDGTIDEQAVAENTFAYYKYDTYMSLGDYNALRKMSGWTPVSMSDDEYMIHLKERVLWEIDEEFLHRKLELEGEILNFAGSRTEAFSQNGINGSDYIIVVPDAVCAKLKPMYSVMVMNLLEPPREDLQDKLEQVYYHRRGMLTETEAMEKEMELESQGASQEELDAVERLGNGIAQVSGSDQIMTMGCFDVAVKVSVRELMLSIVSAITFPLAYISLIFLCVALTILAVQQLSDSAHFRYRYDVLRKLGTAKRELSRMIGRQLAMYYLIPCVVSLALSSVIGIFAGERFVFYTGAHSNFWSYYVISVVVFVGIYLLYFAATYLGFKRNVEQVFIRME